jgi:Family of unknown function (DUF5318)
VARSYTAPVPSQVDYALARRAVLRDVRRGSIRRRDVCDAHPELLRAGRNVGERAAHDCPVCGRDCVRYVSYVYGDSLKAANGRCITNAAELDKLAASFEEFACYVVEVCLACGWNHLDRRYLLGRRHAGSPSRPARNEETNERLHPSRAGLSPG